MAAAPIAFALTMFVSAALLFLVQPMIAKMVLPLLGGTPAVWNTCMVFFQAAAAGRLRLRPRDDDPARGPRARRSLHVGLLLLRPRSLLPIGIPRGRGPRSPPAGNPSLWLLGLLAVAVGPAVLRGLDHRPAAPALVRRDRPPRRRRPVLPLRGEQPRQHARPARLPARSSSRTSASARRAALWAGGYGVLVLADRWRARRRSGARRGASGEADGRGGRCAGAARPGLGRRLRWVGLAFVPSSLMLGVTTYLTTDIAADPAAVGRPAGALPADVHPGLRAAAAAAARRGWSALLPMAIVLLVLVLCLRGRSQPLRVIPLHLLAFFVVAMVCHGELARDRPPGAAPDRVLPGDVARAACSAGCSTPWSPRSSSTGSPSIRWSWSWPAWSCRGAGTSPGDARDRALDVAILPGARRRPGRAGPDVRADRGRRPVGRRG